MLLMIDCFNVFQRYTYKWTFSKITNWHTSKIILLDSSYVFLKAISRAQKRNIIFVKGNPKILKVLLNITQWMLWCYSCVSAKHNISLFISLTSLLMPYHSFESDLIFNNKIVVVSSVTHSFSIFSKILSWCSRSYSCTVNFTIKKSLW